MRRTSWIATFVVLVALLAGALGWASAGAPGAPTWMRERMGMAEGMRGGMYDASMGPGAGMMAGSSITIRDQDYHPMMRFVRVGDEVTWNNLDEMAHTVTSDGGWFDSGILQPGDAFSFTFDRPGTYRYHCTPHSYQDADGTWVGQIGTIIVDA